MVSCSQGLSAPPTQSAADTAPARGVVAWLLDVAGQALHFLRCCLRCVQLASLALPPVLWLPVHALMCYPGPAEQQDAAPVGAASSTLMVRLLCNALERAGPTAIKLGQWASTRPDLFPPELCVHFSARLHAAVTPHSATHSRRALEAVLAPAGLELKDVFDELDFDVPPLGSGCVAQVHGAMLRADVAQRAWAQAHIVDETLRGIANGEEDTAPRRVVVKILHPGVESSVALDMALLEGGVGFLTHWVGALPMLSWIRILRLPELVADFKRHLLSQLDLRTESENLREFRRNFAGRKGRHTTDEAVFPAPLAVLPLPQPTAQLRCENDENDADDFGRTRVGDEADAACSRQWCAATPGLLVESWESGIGLDRWLVQESESLRLGGTRSGTRETRASAEGGTELEQQHKAVQDQDQDQDQDQEEEAQRVDIRRRLAERGVAAFFQMVLVDNFVHADLHPGNILLRTSAAAGVSGDSQASTVARDEVPRLVFLDAGLVVRLSEREKRNFCDLFLAVARGEGTKAGQLIVDRSPGGREGVKRNGGDPDRFVGAIAAVVEDVAARKFQLGSVAIGPVLLAVLSAVRMDRVPLEPAFGNLVSAIVVLEGIGRQLHPELDLFGVAVPMLAKQAMRQMVGGGSK